MAFGAFISLNRPCVPVGSVEVLCDELWVLVHGNSDDGGDEDVQREERGSERGRGARDAQHHVRSVLKLRKTEHTHKNKCSDKTFFVFRKVPLEKKPSQSLFHSGSSGMLLLWVKWQILQYP